MLLVMRVRLHLRGVRVTEVAVDTSSELVVDGGFYQKTVVVSGLWASVSAGT